jgi:arylsulfatase A-like enzyme
MKPLLAILCILGWLSAAVGKATPPNIVVIISDDQGYADFGFNPHHPKEVSTPHLDALAKEGVFFTQAYTSGPVCSPTRAGLMLGRYQQRVGVYTAGDGGRGFDPTLPIFPSFLPRDYVRMAIGKWHLGLDQDYPALKWHALNRGFDECYLFMGRGGHDYFRLKGAGGEDETGPLYRGKQRIDDEGYLTTRLTEEAVAFIGRNRKNPFFLYLAYNAVHAPAQAPREDIERMQKQFPDLRPSRVVLMAMLHHLDRGVGAVVQKLKDEGLWDNTLVFFLTDNGGARAMDAVNSPLRGFKGSLYEGGIRTPFVVSWPARFRGGRTSDAPIISLDILPTALDACGVAAPTVNPFDGKSLLPLLTGQSTKHHDTLYWSTGGLSGEWAVRRGDWKLRSLRGQLELFQLADDPSEKMNLAAKHPDTVKALTALYDAWLEPMAEPIVSGRKRWAAAEKEELTPREQKRLKKRMEGKRPTGGAG